MAKIIEWSLNFTVGATTESTYALLGLIGNSRYDDVTFRTVHWSGIRLGNSGAKRTFGKLRFLSAIQGLIYSRRVINEIYANI